MNTKKEDFWQTLAKRKVIRTLGIYLAAAWLILQIGYLVVDIWQLSAGFVQVLFSLLVLGFPLTAVLAWVYDMTEEGPVRSKSERLQEKITSKQPRSKLLITFYTLLSAIFIAFTILHLWPDDDLDPRLRHVLASQPSSDSDPNNAAFMLHGFSAPAGQDPYEYGRFITDTYQTLRSLPENTNPLEFTIELNDRASLYRLEGNDEKLFANIDSIPAVLTANAEMMNRYEMLKQTPVFTEVIRPTTDSPVVAIKELLLAEYLMRRKIVFEAERGDPSLAWQYWHEELKLRRSLLASGDYILMKVTARDLVSDLIRLRTLLLARGHTEHADLPAVRLSLQERSMISGYRFELYLALDLFIDDGISRRIQESANLPNRLLFSILPFRPNATINIIAKDMDLLEASLLDTTDFIEWEQNRETSSTSIMDILTNGAGVILFSGEYSVQSMTEYQYKLFDLDRIFILAQVAEQMLESEVKAADANGWIRSLSNEFRDPFTGQRPTWSAGVLSYPDPGLDFEADRGLDIPLP